MCGIVASVSYRGRVSPEALARATRALRHRGPDSERTWVASHGRVGLGHARLSIIDLATGRPADRQRGRLDLQIVVNGEFYDFERIRQRARVARASSAHPIGQRNRPAPLRGPRCRVSASAARRVRLCRSGTSRTRTLFAGRDRFGIKPLYYALHDGACHLASEVKALFASSACPCGGTTRRCSTCTAASCIRPIGRRSPASTSAARLLSGHRRRACQHPQLLGLGLSDGRSNRRIEIPSEWVRACIPRSSTKPCACGLRADVPVACYLSGGIDSCAVLGARVAAVVPTAPRLHPVVRHGGLRRAAHRRGTGQALRSRVLPHRDPLRRRWPTTSPMRSTTPNVRS